MTSSGSSEVLQLTAASPRHHYRLLMANDGSLWSRGGPEDSRLVEGGGWSRLDHVHYCHLPSCLCDSHDTSERTSQLEPAFGFARTMLFVRLKWFQVTSRGQWLALR